MTQKTISDLLPGFFEDLEEKGRSPSTVLAYKADLEQLRKYLQEKNVALIADIATDHIEGFKQTLQNQKYSAKSVSRKLNAVKTFFRWLVAEKYITSDPSEDVAHPKISPSVPKFLSPIEYRALRDVVRDDVRITAIIELILQTGLRISEVANLKISDLEKDSISVEATSGEKRKIPLNEPAHKALEDYIKIRPTSDNDHVFISKNGKPLAIRNIRSAVDRYLNKAEIPHYSVNDLRTTFLVENIKAGVDLILLSQIVGHKRLSTTERYLELAGVDKPGTLQTLVEL